MDIWWILEMEITFLPFLFFVNNFFYGPFTRWFVCKSGMKKVNENDHFWGMDYYGICIGFYFCWFFVKNLTYLVSFFVDFSRFSFALFKLPWLERWENDENWWKFTKVTKRWQKVTENDSFFRPLLEPNYILKGWFLGKWKVTF